MGKRDELAKLLVVAWLTLFTIVENTAWTSAQEPSCRIESGHQRREYMVSHTHPPLMRILNKSVSRFSSLAVVGA